MSEPRTINIRPTWQEAMQILIAALEHGTGEGRDAARKELHRAAGILDALAADRADRLDVFDVIANHPDGSAYGITFSNQQAANEYARRMIAAGYEDCAVLPITARETSAAGIAEAADYFGDASLRQRGSHAHD